MFWSVPMARSLTSERRLGLRLAHAQARELAGHQPAVGIVEHRAHPHRAAARIDLVVDQLQLALERGRRWSRSLIRTGMRSTSPARRWPRPSALSARITTCLVGIEARIDRIDRDQRRQHRRAGAGRDEIADGDLEPADAAGDRRADLGVVEIELRRLQRRPRGAQIGLGLALRVERAGRARAARCCAAGQLLAALVLALGQRDARLGRRDLRLRPLDLGA